MTATAVATTPLLDGPRRAIFFNLIVVVLALITIDGVLTWVESTEADDAIESFEAAHRETYPTGLGDTGNILLTQDRPQLAAETNGDRLDEDLVRTKAYLAIIGLIAAVALTIAAGPGSSRNVLAWMIVIAAGAFFVPLIFYSDTIRIVTNAHAG